MRCSRRAMRSTSRPDTSRWPRPGSELVQFSPSEQLREVDAIMLKNVLAMQDG
jgi:hypothetical protein